jgi:hypothetical protein
VTTLSPTRSVLAHIEHGASSIGEIARRTGLARAVVDMAVQRLVAQGYLRAEPLAVGCPQEGCAACPAGDGGHAGCGGTPTSGPVMITLGPARR